MLVYVYDNQPCSSSNHWSAIFIFSIFKDIQLNGHDNEAPENRLPLPSIESSNLQQENNENHAITLSEPTTSMNDLFADEESYPNIWDEDFVDALLTSSPFLRKNEELQLRISTHIAIDLLLSISAV